MAAARERQQDDPAQEIAAPEAVPQSPASVPAGPMNAAGVMALQRLVGNAAVADMLDEKREPQPGGPLAEGIAGRGGDPASAGLAAGGPAPGGGPLAEGMAGRGGEQAGGAQGESPDFLAMASSAVGAAATTVGMLPGGSGVLAAFEAIVRGTESAPPEGAAAGGVGAAAGAAGAAAAGGVAEGAAAGAAGAAAGTAGAAVAGGVAEGAAAGAAGAAGGVGAAAAGAAGAAGGVGAAAAGAANAAAGAGAAAQGAQPGAAGAGPSAAGATAAGAAAEGAQAAGGAGAAQEAAGGGSAAAAEPAPSRAPSDDPNFQAMKGKAGAAGAKAKAHQPASAGAAAAQAAAQPPGNEVASQAQGAQVEEMGQQQPGVFDRKAFIAAVKKAIDAAAPKNLEEADDFKGSGKAGEAKEQVGALVKGGKKDAEKDIKGATEAPPDTSKAKPKTVVPLAPEEPGAATASVGAAAAMPGPRPAEETDLSAGPAEVEQQMTDAEVSEAQLKNANEPEFNAALDAKQEAKEHATTAPVEYRAQETAVLAQGREEAESEEAKHLKGMQGSKVEAIAKVAGHKGETKSEDESKRTKVAGDIQAIYDKTKTEVTGILTALDGKVEATFTRGEASARKQFEDYVGAKMDAYKDDRYSGFFGGARWLKDKLFGMPDEVNVFYSQGRDGYLAAMDGVIGEVADLVGGELNAARMKIAAGRAEVHDYVTQLPQDLQKVGKDAEAKLDQQWDDLSSDVDNKQDAMVDSIAQKYVASRDELDSRIDELKAANKGLVAKALDAVVGVIKTILKLKDMLLNVLAKAADVIGDIITDPIGFLSNLIGGIKDGLGRFVDNIATHLENGLMGWLFGALGDAGITLPKTFDLAGIFELVMDVLGLTYRSIRGRVAKIVGEPVVEKMEQTVDVFKILVSKGVAGLWDWIKEKIGDFQDLVLGGIKDFIIERVIKGGITWLLSLLNPAAAFIKACKAIYDIVMFIVERGSQIMEFVNSVLDSIGAIARGQLSVAAEKVETALAKALPLAISFLASLLGLGGITDKIKEGIDKVRKPIEKAVDFVVIGAVKGFKKLFGGAIGWVKGKAAAGKQWVKDKAETGKQWAVGKAKGIKNRLTGGGKDEADEPQTPEEQKAKEADVTAGLGALDEVTATFSGRGATIDDLKGPVASVRQSHPVFKSIEVVPDGEDWDYVYTASPSRVKSGPKKKGGTFKLTPGGLQKQEGRILEGVKEGKAVHLFARHVDPSEEDLVERLEEQVAEFVRLRDARIDAERQKIVDAEAANTELDAAPEPTSKKEKKVVDTVVKRGEDYRKQAEAIQNAKRRISELERMDEHDRDTVLEQLKNWRGGMPTAQASKFRSGPILEQSVEHAIKENQVKIDDAFTGKPPGESLTIRSTLAKSIGIGFELNERNQVVPTPSMMKSIVIILVLVDDEHFVVETAYPE
jgi:hypothetical protein